MIPEIIEEEEEEESEENSSNSKKEEVLKELDETEETDKGGGKQQMDSYGKLENEPHREKTSILHMRKQRRRSASRLPRS